MTDNRCVRISDLKRKIKYHPEVGTYVSEEDIDLAERVFCGCAEATKISNIGAFDYLTISVDDLKQLGYTNEEAKEIIKLPTDEEIQSVCAAEGITDINPEEVRDYIKESLYKLFCEAADKNEV